MKYLFIIGTRPEAVKVAPVAKEMADRGLSFNILCTGQHPRGIVEPILSLFGVERQAIHYTSKGSNPFGIFADICQNVSKIPYDSDTLVLVQGDTFSCLAGAYFAYFNGLKLAHIEAGLRSFDRNNPFPEESIRVAVDDISDYLFAPTGLAGSHVGVEKKMVVTGNTVVDALTTLNPKPCIEDDYVLVTCHRRETWGENLALIVEQLDMLAHEYEKRFICVMHPNPQIQKVWRDNSSYLELRQPVEYPLFLSLIAGADFVITDSGGTVEEASVLGKHTIVLRKNTERREAVCVGLSVLVGNDGGSRLVDAVETYMDGLPDVGHVDLFGDGKASKRIVGVLEDE